MKKKTVLYLFGVVGFAGWCLWGCEPPRSYSAISAIPEIHFKSLVFEDRILPEQTRPIRYAVLTFSFIDGDGDIGVRKQDRDSVSRIHYTWYQKLPDMDSLVPHKFSSGFTAQSTAIPHESVMDRVQNKLLKGTIEIALFAPTNIQDVDTMRIRFYIVDRAKNSSNEEDTPDFSIQNPPAEPIMK